MRRARVKISGRVQGVFFRASCADQAQGSGISGWVRNASAGIVEAVFEGEESGVEAMIAWCRKGPPHARVDDVEVTEEAPIGAEGFHIVQ